MDIDPELAAARMGKPRDRYERSSFAEKQKLRQAYRRNAATNADAAVVHLIDASSDPKETHATIYEKFCAARLQRCHARSENASIPLSEVSGVG